MRPWTLIASLFHLFFDKASGTQNLAAEHRKQCQGLFDWAYLTAAVKTLLLAAWSVGMGASARSVQD